MALNDAAMRDEYFIKRKLAPNVDFWCVVLAWCFSPTNAAMTLTPHVLHRR